MNLVDALRSLDHDALDTIYDNLPFIRTLSQNPGREHMPLRKRHEALAEALLLARDSFIQSPQNISSSTRRGRLTDVNSPGDSDLESSDDEDSDLDEQEDEELDTQEPFRHESTLSSAIPLIQARSSSAKYQHYPGSKIREILSSPNMRQGSPAIPTVQPQQHRRPHGRNMSSMGKSAVYVVPPTVNPYDPKRDHLPSWLKRTYMYWRWTLKLPSHDVPQRYAVWIVLHLCDISICYHVQNVPNLADEGRFRTSIEVNDYILKKAAGHIKIQEDFARVEFNRMLQRESTSVVNFNSKFLMTFNKVKHYYHPDRYAIQYFDRILPRLRQRLSVNFYERYTTSNGNIRPRSFPTLEGLMLAAEQIDDFYRPLPPTPRKPGFFEIMTYRGHGKKLTEEERKPKQNQEKLKVN